MMIVDFGVPSLPRLEIADYAMLLENFWIIIL